MERKNKIAVSILFVLLVLIILWSYYVSTRNQVVLDRNFVPSPITINTSLSPEMIVLYNGLISNVSKTKDVKVCSKIKDDYYHSVCLIVAKKCSSDDCRMKQLLVNSSLVKCTDFRAKRYLIYCKSYKLQEKDINNAIKKDDPSYCNLDKGSKDSCLVSYYISKAGSTKNSSYCYKISQKKLVDTCLDIFKKTVRSKD